VVTVAISIAAVVLAVHSVGHERLLKTVEVVTMGKYGHNRCRECKTRTESEKICPNCGSWKWEIRMAGTDFPTPSNGWGDR